jgi:glycosyltransferase involved in cell wall biosynthesis
MLDNPLVSAIVPTYNRAAIVCDAIDSILKQTYKNIEVIVVDDGSTDSTQQILQKYGDKILVVSQQNAGPSKARNQGVAAARGELIAFLDSDDLWLSTKIERQVSLLQKVGDSIPACVCNITMRWSDGERASFQIAGLDPDLDEGIWLNADEVIATRFLLFNQGVMIRRDALRKIGCFDETLRLLEDHELALRLSLEGAWAFIREPLVIWRETKAGSLYQDSKKDELSWGAPVERMLEAHLKTVIITNRPKRLQHYVKRELKNVRRQLSAARMARMDSRAASIVGRILTQVERCRRAILVRSPWFPKMKTCPATLTSSEG